MLLAGSLGGCGVPSERADAGADAASTPDATPDAGWDAGPQLPDPPATLSQAGLFVSGVAGPTVAGALPYDVRYPLWTDGADKERYLVLPDGGSIDTTDPDQWAFPEGTRVFKTFLVEGTPVETRLLWKAGPSVTDWVYVSYRYRPDGSDADPVLSLIHI